jgi:hypothetical protein
MPINYLSIKEQIPNYVELHHQAYEKRLNLKDAALDLLQTAAKNPAIVAQQIEREQQNNQFLQSAGPFQECMSEIFTPAEHSLPSWQMLGVDGSQISPDPHSPLTFGLVNIGIFEMPGDGINPPHQQTISKIIVTETETAELYIPTEEEVHFLRDLEERKILVSLSMENPDPLIALTDGPLGLFREPQNDSPWFHEFETLMKEYQDLPSKKRIIAGYVDRPRSNMVVQMLNLWLKSAPPTASQPLNLDGLRDADLFADLIPAGHRSAVFALHSRSGRFFQGELALHFFYLNVSTSDIPALVRVEIPGWVAKDNAMVNQIHVQLLAQCKILGSQPYPYVLHRAHEVAIVHQDEKYNLESMMTKVWLEKGLPIPYFSNKQALKNLVGTRRRI